MIVSKVGIWDLDFILSLPNLLFCAYAAEYTELYSAMLCLYDIAKLRFFWYLNPLIENFCDMNKKKKAGTIFFR